MLISVFNGEQSATQVCEPNQAHPSEWTLAPRHTPPRKHDCQRVASYHFGSDTRWGCTECHCQHGAYCHVRIAISQSLRIFRHSVTSASSVLPRRIVLTQTITSDTCSLGSFAEIIPQSVCTRHGLYIGAKMVFFVRILLWTLVRPSIIVRYYV
jgi:hypothetical protein